MEIQQLKLFLTEQDLNDLARRHIPAEVAVEDLQLHILPEGVQIKGLYQVFVPVTFELLWELAIEQGAVIARLAKFRTTGMPTNVVKSLIVNVLADLAKTEKWLTVKGDIVRADIDCLLQHQGLTTRTHLRLIRCEAGRVVVEGGI
jgi:hypothetical protein